jgi:hypothetical protein
VSSQERRHRGEDLTKILFVAPAALAMLALFGYPVVKNLVMSLQDYTLKTFFTGQAPWVGLRNYTTVVQDQLFSQAMVTPRCSPSARSPSSSPSGWHWRCSSAAGSRSAICSDRCSCCPGCYR